MNERKDHIVGVGWIVRVCIYLMLITHVVPRALAAQASGPGFDFQHISYLTSYIKHVHVLAFFCLSCFYEMTFLGIIWQMMQTQYWNVSSCLVEPLITDSLNSGHLPLADNSFCTNWFHIELGKLTSRIADTS